MSTRPSNGPAPIHLASSLSVEELAANSNARLRLVLASLEQCQASLASESEHATADLVAVAILNLRMKLSGVTESELRLLCDLQAEEQSRVARTTKAPRPRRRRVTPCLKLVK
jgi:hypothetical protein